MRASPRERADGGSPFPSDEVSDEKADPEGGHGDEGGVVVRIGRDALGGLPDLPARGLQVVAGAVGGNLGLRSEFVNGVFAARDRVVEALPDVFTDLPGFAGALPGLFFDCLAVDVVHWNPPA